MSRWHTTEFDLLPEQAFRPRGWKGSMTLEGGGKGDAPTPDPRMGEAALKQIALNERIFDDYTTNDRPWMQGIANEALGISRRNADSALELNNYQLDNMRRNDDRYWSTAVPFENELLADSRRFDSAEYKQGMVDKSMGDVQTSFDKAQEQTRRGLSRMGVNPNSGRATAMASMGGFEMAKAMSDAANKTRMAADQVGLSTKMQMYGGMKGLAGLGATNAGLALNSMGAAQGAAGGMTGAAGSYLGANNAALGAMNSGVSAGVNGYGNYISAQQNATKINNDADPTGSILGAAATVGAAFI